MQSIVNAQAYGDGNYGDDVYGGSTPTATSAPTSTLTPTATNTPTITSTPTPTNTGVPTPTPIVTLNALSTDPDTDTTTDTTPDITGTATITGSTITSVEFQVDSTSGSWTACTATVGSFDTSTEQFTCAVSTPLSDSTHTVYVRATDANTLTSANAIETFVVDTTAPTVDASAISSPTGDSTPLLSGTASDVSSYISLIEYQVDSTAGSWSSCSASDSTYEDELSEQFSCTVSPALSDGSHTVYFRATDTINNRTSSGYESLTFTVDTTAPSLSVVSLSPDPSTTSSISIGGTVTDTSSAISSVQYQMDSTSGSWSNCSPEDGSFDTATEFFSCSVTSLSEGSHTMYIRASDALSNTVSSYASDTFIVNSQGPTNSSISSSVTSTTATITWTTDEATSSQVNYGLISGDYIVSTTESDTSPRVTSHSVSLSGLVACTTYHYTVRSEDSGGQVTTSTDSSFTTTGCTGSASIEAQSRTQISSSSGGNLTLLTSSLGIALTAPIAYADSDLYFQIKKLDETAVINSISTPTNVILGGDYIYDMKAFSAIDTVVTSFDESLNVTIGYADSDIPNINESTLKIYRWDGSSWSELSGCLVDASNNQVTCTTTSFSIFGLFGTYQSSSSSVTTASSSSSSQHCSALKPIGSIHLFQVDRSGSKATLHFVPSQKPYDRYVISFGYDENAEHFNGSFQNSYSDGALTYTVNYLDPGVPYYFKVRAQHNCMPGDWGNTIKTSRIKSSSSLLYKYYPSWIQRAAYTVTNWVPQPVSNTSIPSTQGAASVNKAPVKSIALEQPKAVSKPVVQSTPDTPSKTQGNWFTRIIDSLFSLFR